MTADPTTLSLADLAAAVVRLGAHRDWYCREDLDLLLTAANRLPVVVADLDAATRRADVIAEAARSVLALAEPLIAKHSGPYPASVVADLRAVLEQPGLVDSLYAAEVLADGCGRTARLEQERDAAIARAERAEAGTVERIVQWLDDVEGRPIGAGTLRDFGLQDFASRVDAFRELFAGALRAGAWRGKEQA